MLINDEMLMVNDFLSILFVAVDRKTFFVNGTTIPRRTGEYVQMAPELCNTYKLIAENGGDDFYNGTLADLIADDLRDLGSIITKKDLELYR